MSIRPARPDDEDGVLALARTFATSFPVDPSRFARTYPAMLAERSTCLLVAEEGGIVAYLLGFLHPTFWANGPVGWVEELMVAPTSRRQGVGSELMASFEKWVVSAGGQVVALATRRAAAFYTAIGYEESATYFRKVLPRT